MAKRGFGMQLGYRKDGGSFAQVGEITDITPPSMSRDLIETTNHSSQVKSYLGGLIDFGELSLTVNYDPDLANHEGLRGLARGDAHDGGGDASNPANYQFQITYGSDVTHVETFNGIVVGFETSAPIDGQLSATITIKVSGSITIS
jgi:hypothetical protein